MRWDINKYWKRRWADLNLQVVSGRCRFPTVVPRWPKVAAFLLTVTGADVFLNSFFLF